MKAPNDKIKIHVFSKHLQWLDYSALAETVAAAGFDGVDLPVRPGGHILPERVQDDLPRAVEAMRKTGVNVDMITTAIEATHDTQTESILKTASALGIKYYRMAWIDYDNAFGIIANLEALKSRFRDLAAMNEHYQVHGAYQNHAGVKVGAPVWDLWHLLKDLDSRWLGCQYDVRHATVEGGNSWELGFKLISPYINTTVIKDFKWVLQGDKWIAQTCPLGEGMVDFKKYFALIKEMNIAGPISMHFEYPILEASEENLNVSVKTQKVISAMQKDLQTLRGMMEMAGL
ncbi:sugar phosphate isomerase/epimerase [candidate division KSB1 bacterium]|nr:sugar phosphate isomerase/epimerase [candidate division KSB1 bacterium]